MTAEAVSALHLIHGQWRDVLGSLDDDEWQRPSACEGWRVQDLVAHVTSNFKEMVDPSPPPPDPVELPAEVAMEALVAPRREWSPAQVLAEYDAHADTALATLAAMQEEPVASTEVPLADLGTYPTHAIADAYAFDHWCHLRFDLLAPAGPIERDLPPTTDEELAPGVQWMLWGIPQMQGDRLNFLAEPITLELTGPGGRTVTIEPPVDGRLVVRDGGGGAATVRSSAADFVAWGTTRRPWRDHVELTGDTDTAAAFLDALDVI